MTTPDVVDQAQHAEVLRLLTRGWAVDKVPAVAHVPADAVQQIAVDAGWPDLDRVRREYAAAAREIEAAQRARRGRPGGLLPAPAQAATSAPELEPEPGPEPEPERTAKPSHEAVAAQEEPPPPDGVLGDLAHALTGHRWRRAVDTCMCGWSEAGASHALHIAEQLQPILDREIDHEASRRAADDIARETAPLRTELAVARAELDTVRQELHELRAAAAPPPPEPEPPEPVDTPCEVCGLIVAAAYIVRTGRARHGHHPDPEQQEDTP